MPSYAVQLNEIQLSGVGSPLEVSSHKCTASKLVGKEQEGGIIYI